MTARRTKKSKGKSFIRFQSCRNGKTDINPQMPSFARTFNGRGFYRKNHRKPKETKAYTGKQA